MLASPGTTITVTPALSLPYSHIVVVCEWRLGVGCESMPAAHDGGADDGIRAWGVRRRSAGKRGVFLHRRLVEVGQRGISVRGLGGSRSGEIRLTRFLRNAKVSVAAIIEAAGRRTAACVSGRHVLAIQDTTSLRDDGGQRSVSAHPTIAVDAESGALLGLVDARLLTREGGLKSGRKGRAFADKQSRRWLDAAVAAAGLRASGAVRVTVICDREGDIYEAFASRPAEVELLIRAAHDRALADGTRLFDQVAGEPEAGRFSIALAAAPGRPARTAVFAVRFCRAEIRRPDIRAGGAALPETVALSLIEAREVDAPAGAACWRLLTTHAVDSFAQARWIVGLYRRRWVIEELFRTLKTRGFDIERVSIAEAPFEKLAAAALVAAVNVMQLVHDRDGRAKRPLEDVFEPDERPALEAVSATLEGKTERQKNPHPKGSLAFAAWVCARLGGWTGYYGKPGPVVMLNGLHQFRAVQQGWTLAQHV